MLALGVQQSDSVICVCVCVHTYICGLPGGSAVKNPLAVQETQVQSLSWEDPLEEDMGTHSSILV